MPSSVKFGVGVRSLRFGILLIVLSLFLLFFHKNTPWSVDDIDIDIGHIDIDTHKEGTEAQARGHPSNQTCRQGTDPSDSWTRFPSTVIIPPLVCVVHIHSLSLPPLRHRRP